MALSIEILPRNDFEQTVLKTAEALEKVALHEKKVAAVAEKLGVNLREAAGAMAEVEKNTSDAAKEADALKKKEQAQAMARINNERKDQKERKKTAVDIAVVGAAITAAVAAAVALGAALANAAYKASATRAESAAMIGAFTDRRGPQALKLIDGLAEQLGMSVDEARAKFVEFRQAGIDNKMSAQLLKMRADLMAVGLSATEADKEIGRVVSAEGASGKAAMLKEIGEAYGGIGDGARAAAASTTTIGGAMNRLDNAVTKELAKLWDDISPEIGKAANALTDFIVGLLKSEQGQAVLKGVADAFKKVAAAVEPTIKFLVDNRDAIGVGMAVAFTAFAVAAGAIVVPLIAAQAAFIGFIAGAAAIGAGVALAAVAVKKGVDELIAHWDEIKALGEQAYEWGANIVDGLVAGISNKIGAAVASAKELAVSIAGPFADALGIKSPSKLFAEYGKNTVEGFEQGEQKAMGATMPLQDAAAKPVEQPSALAGGGTTSQAGGGGGGSIVIQNLTVGGGGNAETIARAIRQELQLLLSAGALSRGGT